MPRKSADASSVKQVSMPDVRPDAPYDLNDVEADVWRQIVNSMPVGYFKPFQHEQLGLLCRHIVEGRYCKAQLDAERRKKKPNLKLALEWKKQWMAETNVIHVLMRAMRMTHRAVNPTNLGNALEQDAGRAISGVDELFAQNEAMSSLEEEAGTYDEEDAETEN